MTPEKQKAPKTQKGEKKKEKWGEKAFFFIPPGPDKKHAVTRFSLPDKTRRLQWQCPGFDEDGEGSFDILGAVLGKRVETQPFVATCLGVGRTQETLVSFFSFVLFIFIFN